MGKTAGGFFGWLSRPAKSTTKTNAKPAKTPAAAAPAPQHSQQFLNSQSSQSATNSTHGIRKDLLRMVLRETLTRNGIPVAWVGADMLRTTGRAGRDAGIHVRLLMHHWDPRLLVHGVAFEQNFCKRVVAMDPLATNWLMGVSWQYAMEDQSACPVLPHPGSWTAMPHEPAAVRRSGAAFAGADVIAGPVTIQKPTDEVKADLDRLLSMHDTDKRDAEDFAATQPIQL
jgi:hypothetical protein